MNVVSRRLLTDCLFASVLQALAHSGSAFLAQLTYSFATLLGAWIRSVTKLLSPHRFLQQTRCK